MTLKIESLPDGNGTTIRLIGRMEEEHLDELKAEVEKAGPKIAFDLEQLTLVDVEAVPDDQAWPGSSPCSTETQAWTKQDPSTGTR